MRHTPYLICLSTICLGVGQVIAAPMSTAPAVGRAAVPAQKDTASDLWLTVSFSDDGHSAAPPDAEVGFLVTPDARFRQQVRCPSGTLLLSGMLNITAENKDDQDRYLIRIGFMSTSYPDWRIKLIRADLNKPVVVSVADGDRQGRYTLTLSRPPRDVVPMVKCLPMQRLPFSVPFVPSAPTPQPPTAPR